MEYRLREINTSKKFTNGSVWQTNNCGPIKIIGLLEKEYSTKTGKRIINRYLVEFLDGTRTPARSSAITMGSVRNLNQPTHYGIGYFGYGPWKTRRDGKLTREYTTWHDMLRRCYDENSRDRYEAYMGCIVDERWYNFQNFCEDIKELEGYQEWRNSTEKGAYALDKDIKVKGNRIYSSNTCMFVSTYTNNVDLNSRKYNKEYPHNGYVAYRSDGYEEVFTNKKKFGKAHHIDSVTIDKCLSGEKVSHEGWMFKIKEDSDG